MKVVQNTVKHPNTLCSVLYTFIYHLTPRQRHTSQVSQNCGYLEPSWCGVDSFIITVIFTPHKDLTVTDFLSFSYSQDSPKTIFVSLVMEWLAFWVFESFRYTMTHILHMELVRLFKHTEEELVVPVTMHGCQLVTLAPHPQCLMKGTECPLKFCRFYIPC